MGVTINPGKYTGKIKDYGYTDPGDKTDADGNPKLPSAMVQFTLDIPDFGGEVLEADIMWFGSFKGGAKPITMDTLLNTLGFSGKTMAELAKGVGSGILNEEREYEIEVEMNTYNGKTQPRIKYINIPGQTRRAERLSTTAAAKFVGGLNLDGELAAMRSKNKVEKKAAAATPPAPKFNEDEDVGF